MRAILLLSLVVCLACWTGCEGESPSVRAQMQRLAGTWNVDFAVNQELVDQLLDGDPDRKQSVQERMVRGAAKQFLGSRLPELSEAIEKTASNSMQLTFSADGTWSSKTKLAVARGEKNGTWIIRESSDDSLEISCTWKDVKSNQSETVDVHVTFLAEDRIRMVPPNMAGTELELTFIRQNAK